MDITDKYLLASMVEELSDSKNCELDSYGDIRTVDHYRTRPIDTESPIQEFYKDETVFITGGTGFLGTLLVEKLLRCCPQIGKLILLVRGRESSSVEDRIREYFSDPVFDTMRLKNPKYAEKVDFTCGQLDDENYGLDPGDLERLISNTSIIFHIAATVRFDAHIRVAYNINVKGTKTLLTMAKRMPKLKSFVHVSTAYCNCDRSYIKEMFYPPIFTSEQLSVLINSSTDEEMAILNELLIGDKPNTYTLTKATAEDLVREMSHELPICVFRPSIVFPTMYEPLPLWMKGFNSILGVGLAAGIGLYRVHISDQNVNVDLVPADYTINAMASLAWYQRIRQNKTGTNIIYNFVSHNDNKIALKYLLEQTLSSLRESEESVPSRMWTSSLYQTRSPIKFKILFYVMHFFPALFFSLGERLAHRKPQVLKFYRRLISLSKAIAYFGLNEWSFDNDNMKSIVNVMSEQDKIQFDSLVSNFRWQTMCKTLHRSITLYFLNERMSRECYQKKMYYIERVDYCMWLLIKTFFLYLFLSFVASHINSYKLK